jgi:enamine deaminase RidA (YjgF/YER057c/UK114 family)
MSPSDMTATAAPRGFSKVRRAHGLVFVSSEVAHTPAGKATGGVAEQTALVLSHLASTLNNEGLGLRDVVQASVCLTRAEDFEAFDHVYRQHFSAPRPARTTVLATPLYPGACVEVTVVAAEPVA